MPINTNITNAVFDGARACVDGAQAVTQSVIGTVNGVQQAINNPQQIGGVDFSRRDYAPMMNPAPPVYAYQPPVYPWAAQQYQQGYSVTNVMHQPMTGGYGYPGISNPQYGRIGYTSNNYTSGFGTNQSTASTLGAGFKYGGIGGWPF